MTLPENKGEGVLFTCGLNCKREEYGLEDGGVSGGLTVCGRICYKDGTCRE